MKLNLKWKSINELNKLKSLEEINLKLNPLNNLESNTNIRQMIISKIGGLQIYNRTTINVRNREKFDERKGAEIDYLKKYGAEWLKITDENCGINSHELEEMKIKFKNEHPRYSELVKSKNIKISHYFLNKMIIFKRFFRNSYYSFSDVSTVEEANCKAKFKSRTNKTQYYTET